MDFKFCKGFKQGKDLEADPLEMDSLYNNLKQNQKPTGLPTPNRKLVSPEMGVRQEGYTFSPTPLHFDSKELADDLLRVYDLVLREDEKVPDDKMSVFLQMSSNIGAAKLSMENITLKNNANAGLTPEDVVALQNGLVPEKNITTRTVKKLETWSDLFAFVHNDKDAHYLTALHWLLDNGAPLHQDSNKHDLDRHFDSFVWFNRPHFCRIVSTVLHKQLIASFNSKYHHKQPRPEVYAYHVDQQTGKLAHTDYIRESEIGKKYFAKYGTYLLRQYFKEGSPTHCAAPEGHLKSIACCFSLKYIFDTNHNFVYKGKTYNVGEELNKMGALVCESRVGAGVHFYDDYESAELVEWVESNVVEFIRDINNEYPFEVNPHNVIGLYKKHNYLI